MGELATLPPALDAFSKNPQGFIEVATGKGHHNRALCDHSEREWVQVTRSVCGLPHQVEGGLDATCRGEQCRPVSLYDRRATQRVSGLVANGRDVGQALVDRCWPPDVCVDDPHPGLTPIVRRRDVLDLAQHLRCVPPTSTPH